MVLFTCFFMSEIRDEIFKFDIKNSFFGSLICVFLFDSLVMC